MYLEYLTEDTFQSIFPNPGLFPNALLVLKNYLPVTIIGL